MKYIYTWYLYMYLCGLMKINLNVFIIIGLSMESYCILLLCIYIFIGMYFLYLLVSFCNLSVHVFIKLIYSKLIYFEGRACYIGKINQYMLQIACSFNWTRVH